MHRNVYLQGELAEKFGHKFTVCADSCAEILKCINANRPSFLHFLRECERKDVALGIKWQEEEISEDTLVRPLEKGDVSIALIPAGSGDGAKKILAAIAIITIGLPLLAPAAPYATYGAAIKAGAATLTGKIAVGLATNLAITGIAEIMAPDPQDDINSQNYLFDGDTQLIEEGDPIPVLYGELRIPGRPISINVINGSYTNPTSILEYDGTISKHTLEPNQPLGI